MLYKLLNNTFSEFCSCSFVITKDLSARLVRLYNNYGYTDQRKNFLQLYDNLTD